jgi:hypothetical protein
MATPTTAEYVCLGHTTANCDLLMFFLPLSHGAVSGPRMVMNLMETLIQRLPVKQTMPVLEHDPARCKAQ